MALFKHSLLLIPALALCFMVNISECWKYGDTLLVHEWSSLDFDWPSEEARLQALRDGSYSPDRNLIAGIKVYQNTVFVTVPRWRAHNGFPATLATVVQVQGQSKLRPYPDWESQKIGDCNAMQYVQSMEVDPNTGLMYVIDTGRIGLGSSLPSLNLCPAKLIIFDLNTNKKIASHDLPDSLVSQSENFINDIVMDYMNGEVRFAYMSDPGTRQLHIFDFKTNQTRNLEDPVSMSPEPGKDGNFTIDGVDYDLNSGINGIAMSPNFDYLFYGPLSGKSLYSVPTSVIRSGGKGGIRMLGKRVSQGGGMTFSSKQLYYGAFSLSAVYYWDPEVDIRKQGADMGTVKLETQGQLVRNDDRMQIPDTFSIDEYGWLWFVSNRLQKFLTGTMDFSGSEINMRIWKVYINETSYLYKADERTRISDILGK